MEAILESFKYTTAFPESRGLGLTSMIVRISFLFILLFTILNSSFSSLSFVQGPNRSTFHKCATKTLVDSLQNDCDVLEKITRFY